MPRAPGRAEVGRADRDDRGDGERPAGRLELGGAGEDGDRGAVMRSGPAMATWRL